MTVRFGVLGAISAHVDDSPVRLGGHVSKAIVARLLIARRRVVFEDQLIEAAWGEYPATTARQNLHHHIAALRRALEPGRRPRGDCSVLVRHGGGYSLAVPDEAVDETRFTRCAGDGQAAQAAGDSAAAAKLLHEAMTLWRGPAYADVAAVEAVQPEAARLTELHTVVREEYVVAMLAVGRHREVLAVAHALTTEQPLRERGWELRALAVYRSGRQAEALAVLRAAAAVLRDELGVDPGPELAALTGAMLRRDPALDFSPPPAAVATRPAARLLSTFVGRAGELAALHELIAGHRLVTVVGPPGVGKSRLAQELHATVDGAFPPVELDGATSPTAALAAALGVPGDDDAMPAAAAAIGDRPGLLVLDDCDGHLAGAAALVTALLQRCPGLRVLVTSRQPLTVTGERAFELVPLTDDGARLLVDRIAATCPGWLPSRHELHLAEEISRRLDGLPLALELVAARARVMSLRQLHDNLAGSASLLADGPVRTGRHRGFAAALAPSLHRLSPAAAGLLRRLATLAGEFDADAAARIGGPGDPLPLLTELVHCSLVTAVAHSCPRRFRVLEPIRRVIGAAAPPTPVAPHTRTLHHRGRQLTGRLTTRASRNGTATARRSC